MNRETSIRLGAGISMMVAGAALGAYAYFLQKKKLEQEFEKRLKFEINETKEYYKRLNKKEEFSDPTEMAKVYEEEIEDLAYKNSEEVPYVISQEQFLNSGNEYQQITVTYFEDDDVLVDPQNKPIEDMDMTIGLGNLNHFGKESKDNNIVYVRNDELSIDFEVIRDKGSYAKDVLGYVEHSEPRGRPRKFRRDDG